MKSLAFFALSAVTTAAMAVTAGDPGTITISGMSSQAVTINGGNVSNTSNPHTYANQNVSSNKGNISISGSSAQDSTLTGSTVTNEAHNPGDMAMQSLASNVGTVNVNGTYANVGPLHMLVSGKSEQTANVNSSTVTNDVKGGGSVNNCGEVDCSKAAQGHQSLASNVGNVTVSGFSKQTAGVTGGSAVTNDADGNGAKAAQNLASNYGNVGISGISTQAASVDASVLSNKASGTNAAALQNVASNYGTVNVSGMSTQMAWITGGTHVANLAKGTNSQAIQNLASNDSCTPPPAFSCIGFSCRVASR